MSHDQFNFPFGIGGPVTTDPPWPSWLRPRLLLALPSSAQMMVMSLRTPAVSENPFTVEMRPEGGDGIASTKTTDYSI